MNNPVIESLVSGSISSVITTIIYQPLEVIKTRIQVQENTFTSTNKYQLIGRATKSAFGLIREHNISYLWRGTGASLVRSVPGVGLYYASLNILQTNLSKQSHRPNNSTQAFYFGLLARSMVSFILLPVTVTKVRYESGLHAYSSLPRALKEAYLKNGWVGVAPTVIRDSLFSGIYYMCYTELKSLYHVESTLFSSTSDQVDRPIKKLNHSQIFTFGIVSGLIASIITNPVDVIKTSIQVDATGNKSMKYIISKILNQRNGYIRFFDGMVPRSLRRTLIAASTWTFYELFKDLMK